VADQQKQQTMTLKVIRGERQNNQGKENILQIAADTSASKKVGC
jgi:hypothetical protein